MLISTGLFFSAVLLAGSMAFGQPGPGFANRKMAGPGQTADFKPGTCMAGMLDLTEDQQNQITELRTEHLKEVLPLKNKLAELRAQYRTLITAASPDQKAINRNIDEQSKVRNQLMKAGTDFRLKFRNVLTEDQRLILDSRADRRGGMKGNFGNCRRMFGMHRGFGPHGFAQQGMHPGWCRIR